MDKNFTYEYDSEYGVLIKCSVPPKIIRKKTLVWKDLGSEDEQYARAIYLGQGCWDRLDTITEEEAHCILKEWGAPIDCKE